jgi:diguanylate cyclase (GGDEF)-like protein/hemerythrin-like metal-binding protein/PAS domain S-box-containing protein
MQRTFRKSGGFLAEWVIAAVCVCVLGAVLGYKLSRDYRLLGEREGQRLSAAASVTGSLVARELEAISLTLHNVAAQLPSGWESSVSEPERLSERLKTLATAVSSVRSFAVVDAHGTVVATNRDELVGRNYREREYFQTSSLHADPNVLYISQPFQGALGALVLAVSRVIPGPDGKFGGLVSAILDPRSFSTMLNAVRYEQEVWAACVHGTGAVFVWEPDQEDVVGKDLSLPGTFFSRHMQSGRPLSVFEGRAYVNDEDSLLALLSVSPEGLRMDHPLVVGVGRNRSAVYAGWWNECRQFSILFGMVMLLGCLGLFVSQRWRSAARLEADQARARAHAAEAEQEAFFTLAPTLFAIVDLRGCFRKVNPAWTEILGYLPEELEGQFSIGFVHDNDKDAALEVLAGLVQGRPLLGFEARFRHKNGEFRFLEWSAATHDDVIFTAAHDVSERKEAEIRLQSMAYHDRLTGLPNRALFLDRFAQAIAEGKRQGRKVGLLFVDLDGFKQVNDTLGHDAGDEVLREVTTRFRRAVRATDTVARIGGDEFVLALTMLNTPMEAGLVARKIQNEVDADIALSSGALCRVGASIGISVFPDDGADTDALLLAADAAMYQSKQQGKNRYTYSCDITATRPEVVIADIARVGVEEIDAQHRDLAERINRLCAVVRTSGDEVVIGRMFKELSDATLRHFATEHDLMRQRAYPRQARHDDRHKHLAAELRQIRQELFRGGDQFLLVHLRTWLLEHIAEEDTLLGEFLRHHG